MFTNSVSGAREPVSPSQARNAESALDIDHGQATADDLPQPTIRGATIAPIQNPRSLITDALKVLDSQAQDMQVTMAIHKSAADHSCSAEWSRFDDLVDGLRERVDLAKRRSLGLMGQRAVTAIISDDVAHETVAGEAAAVVGPTPNDDQPTEIPGGSLVDGEGPGLAHQNTDNAEHWKERAKASGPSHAERGLRFQFGGSFNFSF
ncbi:uncharacterized protein SCHCODRAFT_01205358 [Schizophyllum commune H4-8]|nr:uncharacterized protein SCHCODRAFT_01205358 [Schizophyllum commune H4-8]KAI5887178.1 hypothetical protein SCHCODRAFT_01205358 [Schizophyllum commune H4-8]